MCLNEGLHAAYQAALSKARTWVQAKQIIEDYSAAVRAIELREQIKTRRTRMEVESFLNGDALEDHHESEEIQNQSSVQVSTEPERRAESR